MPGLTKPVVLQIGGGLEHVYGVEAAHNLGYEVVVIDYNPEAPAFSAADDHARISTYDYDGILEYAKGRGDISGVWTVASDVPLAVSYVAHHLGLFSSGIHAGWITSDKWRMQRVFDMYGVPHPRAKLYHIRDADFMHKHHELAKRIGYPLIVKPTDSRGGRGVNLIREKSGPALDNAVADAALYSESGGIIIQEYLPGPQLSVEGYMVGGRFYGAGYFDRNYEYLDKYAPHIVENGGEMPSRVLTSKAMYQEVNRVMQAAADACAIHDGPIKGDLVIHDGVVKVIEIANRLSGGFFATVAINASTGIDLIGYGIDRAVGRQPRIHNLKPLYDRPVVIRFAFPTEDQVGKKLSSWWLPGGIDLLVNNVLALHVMLPKGAIIEDVVSHPNRLAAAVATGKTIEEAIELANAALDSIIYRFEDYEA